MNRESRRPRASPRYSTDGGGHVLFEETLSLNDESGARRLITVVRLFALFMILATLVGVVIIVQRFVSIIGGTDVALSIIQQVRGERPRAFVGFLLFGVVAVGIGLFLIVGFLWKMNTAFDKQVHVRVTERGMSVQRTGSGPWQSSGVEIPFDDIASVEYADPEESSKRIEISVWRARKFFGGRSKNWIRIEQTDDSPVYVGSDRPNELATIVAQRAPKVENVQPF